MAAVYKKKRAQPELETIPEEATEPDAKMWFAWVLTHDLGLKNPFQKKESRSRGAHNTGKGKKKWHWQWLSKGFLPPWINPSSASRTSALSIACGQSS